jgi:hypothetical protein
MDRLGDIEHSERQRWVRWAARHGCCKAGIVAAPDPCPWHDGEGEPMRDQLKGAVDLLRELVDPDPCRYDHNDLCQAHSLDPRPCPHERARTLVGGR